MLRAIRLKIASQCLRNRKFQTTAPNPPLKIDPSLQALLKDVDMSLVNHKHQHVPPRELESLSGSTSNIQPSESDETDEFGALHRKSPAGLFGSQRIGSIVIPSELQLVINQMISESDKPQLHNDAKRLFGSSSEEGKPVDQWDTLYDQKYKSRRQASRHAERDGSAFATVALPAHYAVIYAILKQVQQRLGPSFSVQKVTDWGSGTGSGLWASTHAFQKAFKTDDGEAPDEPKLSHSTILSYLGIDKREGLVSMGKRLIEGKKTPQMSLTWQKSLRDDNKISRDDGHDSLALSAFYFSSLPTPLARKVLAREIWDSGAHTIVLIDHSTPAGYEAVAEARNYFLDAGRKEMNNPDAGGWAVRGSHVVAPCPHDGACPLHQAGSNRLVCGFSQRLQRPTFIRLTKHSGTGHEDIGYSYVVIQRGPRPQPPGAKVGRVGEVGQRAMDKAILSQTPIKELTLHDEHFEVSSAVIENGHESINTTLPVVDSANPTDVQRALRLEAFSWPRLVFPPLKRSGHVILDSCTSQGKIMRLTIPKSQGKQEYYDARKSAWGDIFPHEPKNAPQERFQSVKGASSGAPGSDIGKRRLFGNKNSGYNELSKSIKEQKRKTRRDRIRVLEN